MLGTIVKGVGGLYTVQSRDERVECRARGVFRKERITPLVGDHVICEDGVITDICARKNALIRPPCANIDKLFIVAAMSDPDPVIYNIDKLLAIAAYHEIEPILIFSKADLPDKSQLVEIYNTLPIRQYTVSTMRDQEDVLEQLRAQIAGNTVALSGLSGVGKSTLMNMLSGLNLQTGDISRRLGRGKHTTRCVELFEACGGFVMDTPGFSNLELEYFGITDRSRLAACFSEFTPYLGGCRFSDCAHTGEPDCAVRTAVENGRISVSRWESYKKMYADIGVYHDWEKRQ